MPEPDLPDVIEVMVRTHQPTSRPPFGDLTRRRAHRRTTRVVVGVAVVALMAGGLVVGLQLGGRDTEAEQLAGTPATQVIVCPDGGGGLRCRDVRGAAADDLLRALEERKAPVAGEQCVSDEGGAGIRTGNMSIVVPRCGPATRIDGSGPELLPITDAARAAVFAVLAASVDVDDALGVGYASAGYDDTAATADLNRCKALPGVTGSSSLDSLPPGITVYFAGTKAELDTVEACLEAMPGARVTTPSTVRSLPFQVTYGPGYQATRDEAALRTCTSLSGVGDVVVAESFPPQVTVNATGVDAQLRAVRQCLDALPGATVRSLSVAPTADPNAPASSPPGQQIAIVEWPGAAADVVDRDDPLGRCEEFEQEDGYRTSYEPGKLFRLDIDLPADQDGRVGMLACLRALPGAKVQDAGGRSSIGFGGGS